MSKIDEIMGAIGRHGDDCIRDADAASASFVALREMIAAALADARHDGAEQMREAAAATAQAALDAHYTTSALPTHHSLAGVSMAIRALPLPAGERHAALLTDEQIKTAVRPLYFSDEIARQFHADDIQAARAIESAVLAANGLEVRRG